MSVAFDGRWVQHGAIKIPVIVDEPEPILLCIACSEPSPVNALCGRCRRRRCVYTEHTASHAGFNAHKRRGEEPCEACVEEEKLYQAERYARNKGGRGRA